MIEYLNKITSLYNKNGFHELDNAVNEKKFLYLYSLYHYYNGDEDYILDVIDNCPYDLSQDNKAQGFFELEEYDSKIIEVLIPYYLENKEFDNREVIYSINQVQNLMYQLSKNHYTLLGNNSKLKEIWDSDEKVEKVIRVVTNYTCDYDRKKELREIIDNIEKMISNVTFEIIFKDEIIEEISQLSQDRKFVDNGELILDCPNNYLKYGNENSIITNIKASSLKENFKKYGKSGLLAKNLRFYVPNKKVDEGLEKSIRENGENFWYYNNGIIIVCDDFQIEGNILKLKNFSIVNGGQTTRMIGVIPFINDFAITCKVIKNKFNDAVSNEKFVAEVAEASNTQKPINSADIIANRYEQRMLKQRLADNGIFMQIKRGESSMINLKENYPEAWQRTKNDELAQLLYAGIYQKPGTARNAKSKIFSDDNKYQLVFGNLDYDVDMIKDILFIRSYYKKWASSIARSNSIDEVKKGLVRNGFLFFTASILLMSKFIYCNDLLEDLKTININTDKGNYLISQQLFNHHLFKKMDESNLNKQINELFECVYDRYISRGYYKLKQAKPDLVYSNFTKTDKNYLAIIASDIYDDFSYELNGRVKYFVNNLFAIETKEEKEETKEYYEMAVKNYSEDPTQTGEVDLIAEELKKRLKEYRTETYKKLHIKAFYIFNDEEMKEIARIKPKNKNELMLCLKKNENIKVRRYGDDILDIVIKTCK